MNGLHHRLHSELLETLPTLIGIFQSTNSTSVFMVGVIHIVASRIKENYHDTGKLDS